MRTNRNKYGNVRSEYKGRTFASKLEATHAQSLDTMRRAKELSQRVVAVIEQYRIPLEVNNKLIGHYVADFYVSFADGHKEIHETKGMKTALYNWKKKHLEAQYVGVKIIEF